MAARYQADVAPLTDQLAVDLIRTIPSARLSGQGLDIGTGAGIVARCLAERGATVIGIDLSVKMLNMLNMAHTLAAGVGCVQADVSTLPFAANRFDLAVSSFGLNLSEPRRALQAIKRVLKPGGWLFGQEWAVRDPLASAFDDLFDAQLNFYVPPGEQGEIAEESNSGLADLPDTWPEQLQDTDDYRALLSALGFTAIDTQECSPLAIHITPEMFLNYRFAWPTYAHRLAPLSTEAHSHLSQALLHLLETWTDSEGCIAWQPNVFRFAAHYPDK